MASAVAAHALALVLLAASAAARCQPVYNPVPEPDPASGELHAYARHINNANTLYRQALWHVISHANSVKTIDGKDITEQFDLSGNGKSNLVVRYRVLNEPEIIRLQASGYSPELEFGCPCRLRTIEFLPNDVTRHRILQRNKVGVWTFVARDAAQ